MTKEAPQVHTKVTRADWIGAALAALENEAIDQLRVQILARDLSVSRSSFYWYFENPDELRTELLSVWERNTASIVERSQRDSPTIVAACLGVFECWADRSLYVPALDLSVRDWGRRDGEIATSAAKADRVRLDALTQMFGRHHFGPADSLVRARLLYHSQVGYYALGTDEPMADRISYLPYYLEAMTGTKPTSDELTSFEQMVVSLQSA